MLHSQKYVNYLNSNFAVKTVRRRIASLRSFYNYLEGEEVLRDNPFIWMRNIAILELLFAGGFRVSELCKLQFDYLSVERLAIRINGKGNKERTIYLENIEVVKALNRYLTYREAVEDGNEYISSPPCCWRREATSSIYRISWGTAPY